ncbi:integrase, catalytic region, zinc finger, CCHC-type containing protein [Tanacetum coccineum]
MIELPLMDSSFVVPVFSPGDDLIACLNKAMAFLTAVASLRYKSNATSSRGNNASGQARVVKCYNCQGEGHMARQCTQPKRPRNAAWYKEKAMLAEARKTEDLDMYDSDCDDISNAQAVLMAIFQLVFDQMDAAVQQSTVDKQCLEIAKKEVLLENDRLLQQIMSQEVLLTVMNSIPLIGESVNMDGKKKETYNLEAELLKSQNAFNDLLKRQSQLEKHSQLQDKDSTICKLKDMIKSIREKSKDKNTKYAYCEIQTKIVELENKNKALKAQIQDKIFVITSLKNDLQKIRGKEIVDIASQIPSANTIVPEMFKLDLEPLAPRLLQNREAHIDYLNYTQKQADILWEIVEQAKADHPLDKELDFTLLKRLLTHPKTRSRKLGLKCSPSKCGSKPTSNKRNDMISQTPSRNMKNKIEAQPRKVNKKNYVVKLVHDDNVKHLLLHANSEPVCATCKKLLFDGVHDICFLDFIKNVNSHAKSAKKHKKENIWRPTGHVFTEVRLKWKLTGRTFTIVGNMCPLTRITLANVVPPKTTTSYSVESQKPELKVYSRKLKNVKNIGSSKKAKIVESKNANHSEPNHTWGSNATDSPSSSSSVMTGCPDCSLVSGLWMFETHDRESHSAHELC